jgi:hypothetical protein
MKFDTQVKPLPLPIGFAFAIAFGEDRFTFISIGYQDRKTRFDFWVTLMGISLAIFYIKASE